MTDYKTSIYRCPCCGNIPSKPEKFAEMIVPEHKECFALNHSCNNVSISVHGDSSAEVIERWNHWVKICHEMRN